MIFFQTFFLYFEANTHIYQSDTLYLFFSSYHNKSITGCRVKSQTIFPYFLSKEKNKSYGFSKSAAYFLSHISTSYNQYTTQVGTSETSSGLTVLILIAQIKLLILIFKTNSLYILR